MADFCSGGKPRGLHRDPLVWANEFIDPKVLAAEQARFGPLIWQFLGLAHEIPRDGDWFTADLAGKSVFVQRFGADLVGFENICAHRFFPLRHEEAGNGPIRCGFHGWMYDKAGTAIGIPICEEIFGRTRRELNLRLKPIEIAQCGGLIFGRWPAPPGYSGARPSLKDWLGRFEPAIAAITAPLVGIGRIDRMIQANWKLCYSLTLDEYHIVAVHPKTFGVGGHLKPGTYQYFMAGAHSAMIGAAEPVADTALDVFLEQCKTGVLPLDGYKIFQIFPNILVSIAGDGIVCVAEYVGKEANRTAHRAWFTQRLEPGRPPLTSEQKQEIMEFSGCNHEDDAVAAERLQRVAHQIRDAPLFSGQEERVGYFDDVYAGIMAG